VGDADVHVDASDKSVRIDLPAPEVFSTVIDEKQTHVYSRTTDLARPTFSRNARRSSSRSRARRPASR
jgi:hypothetical protein